MTITASQAAEWIAPRMKGWEDVPHTTNVLQWYMDRGLCGIATEDGGIKAVACVRFLEQTEDGLEPYKHEPNGQITWVELVVSEAGGAIASLFRILWDRYGKRPYVAYQRGLKNGRIRTYRVRMFEKMNRLSESQLELHGGLSNVSRA